MKDSLSVAIPCRASEPGLLATLESVREACRHPQLPTGVVNELLLCINGIRTGEDCAPLTATREFCQQHNIVCEEVWIDDQGARNGTENWKHGEPETSPSFCVPAFQHSSIPASFPRCTTLLT